MELWKPALLAVSLLLPTMQPARAGEPGTTDHAQAAAMLAKLARFVDWPPDAQPDGEPLLLVVLGTDPFGRTLDEALRRADQQVDIRVLRAYSVSVLPASCDMVFICAESGVDEVRTLDALKGRPILTIGDAKGFEERGGMVEFREAADGNIRLAFNLDALAESGIRVPLRLLRLAASVRHRGVEEEIKP